MNIIVGTKPFSQFPGTLHEPNLKNAALLWHANRWAHLQEDYSRYSRRAKNWCWFLNIHVSWKAQDSKYLSDFFLTLSWPVLDLLISGEMKDSFNGACYYFLLVFINDLAWTTAHLKTITSLGFLSFYFLISALQGISLRKLTSLLGCCSDTASKFLC